MRRVHYVIRRHPHPAGLGLAVEDPEGHLLFLVRHRPAMPSHYLISPAAGDQKKALIVKLAQIGLAARGVLFDGGLERLSLLQAPTSPEFLLRDAKRRPIARFKPLGPNAVILRTPTMVLARLRLTEYAVPLGPRVEADVEERPERLLAVIVYAIMITELMTRQGSMSGPIRAVLSQQVTSQP